MSHVIDGCLYYHDPDTLESILTNYPEEISSLYVDAYKEKTWKEVEIKEREFERQADQYDREKLILDFSLLPADFGGLFDD